MLMDFASGVIFLRKQGRRFFEFFMNRVSYKKLLIPLLLFVLAVASFVVLQGGRGGKASYVEMACGFEERSQNCIDSVAVWREGLSFYDSTLSVTKDTLETLKMLLWEHWNVEFAGAGEAAVSRESILPLQVLETKKSGCVGLTWLAMMVAEARGIDLKPVLLPGHVFMRYGMEKGNGIPVNLEPNRRGYSYTDAEYKEKYKAGPWTGLEFKPLTSTQFIGLAAFNMGNLYLENDIPRALRWYRMADSFFGEYPGIKNNQKLAKSRLPDHI